MIARIDLFMPPVSQYDVLPHLTKELCEALQRKGVDCRLLVAEKDHPEPFLDSIFSDPPDCTLSLNGLLPDEKGRFFCEMIKIPHVACLVDSSPNLYIPLTQSSLNIITCPDTSACQFFRGLNFDQVLFMPHGVDPHLAPDPRLERIYDVVFLGSCIDFEEIRKQWKKKFSPHLIAVLDKAQEITLSDQSTSFIDGLVQAMNEEAIKSKGIDLSQFNIVEILDELEMYVRGKDRISLIRSIKDAKVDIFGSGEGWTKYLNDQQNVALHDPVPFDKAIDLMKQSKIVLNSCPTIKHGGHERLFAGMACEALSITNENPFLTTYFKEGEDLLFYRSNKLDEINDRINHILSDEQKRKKIASSGRAKVIHSHTWDHRAEVLLKQLPPLLEKAKKNIRSTPF